MFGPCECKTSAYELEEIQSTTTCARSCLFCKSLRSLKGSCTLNLNLGINISDGNRARVFGCGLLGNTDNESSSDHQSMIHEREMDDYKVF